MFGGVATLNLDSKGRLAIPAKHRDALLQSCGGRLTVTVDPSQCLLIYPQPAWEPVRDKLNNLPAFNPHARALQRLILGHAEEVELDSAGRILVSPALRAFAGLDRAVALVGLGSKFELWDEIKWQAQTAAALAMSPEDIATQLEGFVL
ncbi:division/cell wall cluster transcriptional repressor MraZ [Chitinimonas sp. BJB300]|uniref:division/cell wall cluster transcriptional repressor MraZ n=1 Tax=Chitinimonas sp. BJB300 TaxID=1559339 RepID=UPI000C11D18A|nr:division/cell wall cluster transcriptional repressor MraZ [Chitinimonas sp. BJB300]PHV12765.1 cell division/cell wall cluster transcriptional repressor MraZ [Chitinimonas sp. BJB300]TSJ91365.1 division/cell wall cluster transcriptional repressor MraZ [Chitinimonas sp. BJB300]